MPREGPGKERKKRLKGGNGGGEATEMTPFRLFWSDIFLWRAVFSTLEGLFWLLEGIFRRKIKQPEKKKKEPQRKKTARERKKTAFWKKKNSVAVDF